MTTILMLDDVDNYSAEILRKAEKLKQSTSAATVKSEESNISYLNVSRENLTISQSDIDEKGFNKRHCSVCMYGMNRQTVFSVSFIVLAIICIAFETFQLSRVLDNSREIVILKDQLDTLRRQFYEEHVLDELKAFEQQLYDDDIEENTDDEDYTNYEDESPDTSDYIGSDFHQLKSSQSKMPKKIAPTSSAALEKDVHHMLDTLHDFEIERDEELEKNLRENHHRLLLNHTKVNNTNNENNSTERQKRFVSDEPPIGYTSDGRPIFAKVLLQNNDMQQGEKPDLPKKQRKYKLFDTTIPLSFKVPANHRGKRRVYRKVSDESRKLIEPQVGGTRRHYRQFRQTLAAHFGADSSLFSEEDEHTGNGRAKHSEGIFKAWRPSDWIDDFGMNRYFSLDRDGKLTIYESGLYLIYAQIHYLDEHDENGFHLLVNGRPILQCMVYSPGTGHKSRSCFSSQATFLQSGDKIIIKDIGVSRYTLFQRDKSFFGLVKIGDMRHPQITSSQSPNDNI